jgi:hypothetical protein
MDSKFAPGNESQTEARAHSDSIRMGKAKAAILPQRDIVREKGASQTSLALSAFNARRGSDPRTLQSTPVAGHNHLRGG